MDDYTMTESTSLIDGVRVFDRAPTMDEVGPFITETKFCNFASVVDRTKMLAICPTPCGVYEGDVLRWEVSEIVIQPDDECPRQVGDCLCLYGTLDEAVRDALGIGKTTGYVSPTEKVFIMRDAV